MSQPVTGWISCAIGSDPTTTMCSPFSTSFNCVWGQDCYMVKSYEPLAASCDSTTFNTASQKCDTQGNQTTFQKCTNWRNNDPQSCSTSTKRPDKVVGYMKCAIGSDPTSVFCSPFSETNNCVAGQDCFVFTQFDKQSNSCVTTFDTSKTVCDSKGSKMSFQKCSKWANNEASSCNTSPNKPAGVIGWIPCAIGSDPTTTMCSPMTSSFSCVWGQDCYAVTEYAQFPNNGSCDTTTYEASKDICDSKAGAMTYQKCTNWFANDPNSCNTSLKKPK
jgi:hypothetical protein